MFKYKLKEGKIIKPNQLDSDFLKKIEDEYGSVDYENDFFSKNLDTYYKTSDINSRTKNVEHTIINLSNFGQSFISLYKALKHMIKISKTPIGKKDPEIHSLTKDIREIFNKYRTHLRKKYPDQYNNFKSYLGENFTPGNGTQTATPFAFKPKYKLKKKQIKEEENKSPLQIFHEERIGAFDEIEESLNNIYKTLSNAKNETADFYQSNPGSYEVVYATDLIKDYLKDINELLSNK